MAIKYLIFFEVCLKFFKSFFWKYNIFIFTFFYSNIFFNYWVWFFKQFHYYLLLVFYLLIVIILKFSNFKNYLKFVGTLNYIKIMFFLINNIKNSFIVFNTLKLFYVYLSSNNNISFFDIFCTFKINFI